MRCPHAPAGHRDPRVVEPRQDPHLEAHHRQANTHRPIPPAHSQDDRGAGALSAATSLGVGPRRACGLLRRPADGPVASLPDTPPRRWLALPSPPRSTCPPARARADHPATTGDLSSLLENRYDCDTLLKCGLTFRVLQVPQPSDNRSKTPTSLPRAVSATIGRVNRSARRSGFSWARTR